MMNEEPPYDRPLECGECRREISVHYTEIVGGGLPALRTGMCELCPSLQRKLYGSTAPPPSDHCPTEEKGGGATAALVCGRCGMTLEMMRTGHPLGCSSCYELFGDLIAAELLAAPAMHAVHSSAAAHTLHIGRQVGETRYADPSMKLMVLNEALLETLRSEDYEQAARLRDQIHQLTESSGGNEGAVPREQTTGEFPYSEEGADG